MYIDWDGLLSSDEKLDYYSVTVSDGKIVRDRAYYLTVKNNVNDIGNYVFNSFLLKGYLKCFSYGTDKYDFLITNNSQNIIYKECAENFSFFDLPQVCKFYGILNDYSFKFINHILGAKTSVNDKQSEIQSICLYFRSNGYFSLVNAKPFIRDVLKKCLGIYDYNFFNLNKVHLHLIALDFSRNEFKVKFYFKFNGDFDFKELEKSFGKTANSKSVSDIVNSNGRLEILQVAVNNSNKTTYNFYFRKN